MAEWGASRFTSTVFLEGFGVRAHLVEYQLNSVVTYLSKWMEWAPTATNPLIFLDTAHKGLEILLFQKNLGKFRAPVAVSVAPSEIAGEYLPNQLRTQHFWIDSSTMGDALGGCWGVFV